MTPIFEYIDYRKFLSQYYEEKKSQTGYFSYRYFSQKAGINSPSFLKHVIDGKRNLTRPVAQKFCTALKLTTKESTYFRNLVLFNQAKTSEEKQEYYAVLRSLAGSVKESVLTPDQFDYFSKWYVPVVREMICLRDFGDDFKAIAAAIKPKILPSEAKAAVELLLRLKLVSRQKDGTYRQTSAAVTADSSVISLAVRSFTKTMFDHAKEAIDTVERKERHISGLTMGVSAATYAVLAAEIESFKDRLKMIVNRDQDGNRIYQMNIALFPVSDELDKGESSKGSIQ
jgi:uncharacterized protein (TIGR02147 family)